MSWPGLIAADGSAVTSAGSSVRDSARYLVQPVRDIQRRVRRVRRAYRHEHLPAMRCHCLTDSDGMTDAPIVFDLFFSTVNELEIFQGLGVR
jgi:hypothetical protein